MKQLQQLLLTGLFVLVFGINGSIAAERTTPPESLNGLRPGTLTIGELTETYGETDVSSAGGLLELYGGAADSRLYGWFMIENPDYDVPDLAVETAEGSDRVDLVMSIGYDGLKTEKGVTCFMDQDRLVEAYGKPDFVYAVPMQGFVLREFYYVDQGISFDVAPIGSGGLQVIAIYVTYPEYMQRAVDLRKQYIEDGVGKDITAEYTEGIAV